MLTFHRPDEAMSTRSEPGSDALSEGMAYAMTGGARTDVQGGEPDGERYQSGLRAKAAGWLIPQTRCSVGKRQRKLDDQRGLGGSVGGGLAERPRRGR